MNNLLLVAEIIFCFTGLLLAKKFFGKIGVFVWIGLASVLANVVQAKNAELLFMNAGIGHVLFSSTFLATDILNECYGQKDAKKGVWIGLFGNLIFLGVMLIAVNYTPSSIDVMHEHMKFMFGLNIRITVSSMFWYIISNFGDVWLYNKLKNLTKGKYMWLRNNVSTIVFNCLENFGFAFFAFGGIYSVGQIFEIALASTVVEIVVGVCDTPFLYISKKIKSKEEREEEKCLNGSEYSDQ
jgi:hypothetical protein